MNNENKAKDVQVTVYLDRLGRTLDILWNETTLCPPGSNKFNTLEECNLWNPNIEKPCQNCWLRYLIRK